MSAMEKGHAYDARLFWEGNTGEGTAGYTTYGRQYRAEVDGKPDLSGSADPAFRGDAGRHNPEDLFLIAIAGCHMLSYLALCAKHGVRVVAYEDAVHGTLALDRTGGGRFTEVVLHPVVTVAAGSDRALAAKLHDTAHERCFIAASCSVPIRHEPVVREEGEAS